jgi:hypothetical protein
MTTIRAGWPEALGEISIYSLPVIAVSCSQKALDPFWGSLREAFDRSEKLFLVSVQD